MGTEDLVQVKDVSYFRFNDVGGVLDVDFSKPGFGVLTRQSAGVYRVTYPAGKGIDPLRTKFDIGVYGALTNVSNLSYSMTTNTETVKEFTFTQAAGEPTLVANLYLMISEILGN